MSTHYLSPAAADVSIRSRLFSREIPASVMLPLLTQGFQSAPGFLAGRYALIVLGPASEICFNPLPAF